MHKPLDTATKGLVSQAGIEPAPSLSVLRSPYGGFRPPMAHVRRSGLAVTPLYRSRGACPPSRTPLLEFRSITCCLVSQAGIEPATSLSVLRSPYGGFRPPMALVRRSGLAVTLLYRSRGACPPSRTPLSEFRSITCCLVSQAGIEPATPGLKVRSGPYHPVSSSSI